MKILAKISAIFGIAAVLTSMMSVTPVRADKKKPGKPVAVHGYIRHMKSGKAVVVSGYVRGAKRSGKKVAVHGYTRKLASGKTIKVHGYMRHAKSAKKSAPKM